MKITRSYTGLRFKASVPAVLICSFMLLLSFFTMLPASGQEEPQYDEIPVFLDIPRIGAFEIPAVIKGQDLYLPVSDLFDFLKIRNVVTSDNETVSGFFISEDAVYSISHGKNQISYAGKVYDLNPGDIVRTEDDLFLRSDYFGKVFGLDCFFSFRNLAVTLDSKVELPLIREMKREEMRKNLFRLKGGMESDTILKRTYPVFRFGMADWSVHSTQEINGRSDNRLNLALGAMVAGGEATASLSYATLDPFSEKQQHYLWRYVDNDFRIFRQAMAGKISTQSTSTLFSPVVGVQFTNTPTTYRHSFGTYTVTDRTEPNWLVELYVNNVLIDFTKADASGFFRFEVPLVYGNSIIQMKFYGPWGEEKVKEQNISIPFSFLPEKTFEYRVSAGIVEDTLFSRFSRISMNYGLSRKMTVGGGIEYLSSVTSTPVMPYLNLSWNVLNNLLLSGEYTYGVRTRGTLSYRMPSNVQVDLNYTRYVPGQKAIFYNYREERKASIAIPLKIKTFSAYNRFSVYQIVLPPPFVQDAELPSAPSNYTTGEWMFSSSFWRINANLSTYALIMGKANPYVYSNLALSLRLPSRLTIMPSAQYGVSENRFISSKIHVEKQIREKAFINISFEQNYQNDLMMAEFGFRYNFRFAQTGFAVRQSQKRTSFIEYARGSLLYDRHTGYLGTDNQFNVGKGGISVIPFIDYNSNGIKDAGEPKAEGLNLRSTGGIVQKNEKDTTILILGLEPYTSCFLDLDANSFENISWRLPLKVINVVVDPEIIKHVEIPVSVVGEASGSVTLNGGGLGRIIMLFQGENSNVVANTLTEEDGYFTWFGFKPGKYSVGPDTAQLRKLGLAAEPLTRSFVIKGGAEGDLADALDFSLRLLHSDTVALPVAPPKPVVKRDSAYMVVHEVVQELVTITEDSYAIQLGAFRNRSNAENLRKNLERLLRRDVGIVVEDNFFKVRIDEIKTRQEVDNIIGILKKNGITELWVISLKAKQQQVVLREKQDSVIRIIETVVDQPEIFESKMFVPFGQEFYTLDQPKNAIIDPTLVKIMKSGTRLSNISTRQIKPVVRMIAVDSVDVIIPVIRNEEMIITPEEAAPEREPVSVEKAVIHLIVPDIALKAEKDISARTTPAAVKEPKLSLQVGVFYKKSEAVKAQKKIMSKLNVPVKIVEQWEYYRVIITGFSSREETFRYYPELAGLGFPGPTLIEE